MSQPYENQPALSSQPQEEGFENHQLYSIVNHYPRNRSRNHVAYDVVFNEDRRHCYRWSVADINAPALLGLYRAWLRNGQTGHIPTVRFLSTGAVTRSQRLKVGTGSAAVLDEYFMPSSQINICNCRTAIEKLFSEYHEMGLYDRVVGFYPEDFIEIGSRLVESQFLSKVSTIFKEESNGYRYWPCIVGHHNGSKFGDKILRSDSRYNKSIIGKGMDRDAKAIFKIIRKGKGRVSVLLLSFSQPEKIDQIHIVVAEIKPDFTGEFIRMRIICRHILIAFIFKVIQHESEIEGTGFGKFTSPIRHVFEAVGKKCKGTFEYGNKVLGSDCLEKSLLLIADKLDGSPPIQHK